jgi:hypothetical protein
LKEVSSFESRSLTSHFDGNSVGESLNLWLSCRLVLHLGHRTYILRTSEAVRSCQQALYFPWTLITTTGWRLQRKFQQPPPAIRHFWPYLKSSQTMIHSVISIRTGLHNRGVAGMLATFELVNQMKAFFKVKRKTAHRYRSYGRRRFAHLSGWDILKKLELLVL